jgi:hypothetical protein
VAGGAKSAAVMVSEAHLYQSFFDNILEIKTAGKIQWLLCSIKKCIKMK